MHMTNFLTSTLAQMSDPMRDVWLPEQSSTFAPIQDRLFMFVFWTSVVFFVLLMGAMFYFVFKYRRRPGVPQMRSPSHNTPLEITWTVLPMFLLVVMFVWGFKGYIYMLVQPAGSEQIVVAAQQWNWEFAYDNGARSIKLANVADKEVPVFPVPAGRPIKLLMSSRDVIHSFFVPTFRTKMDIFPNRYTTIWFEATDFDGENAPSGPDPNDPNPDPEFPRYRDHYLFCAEYCGEGHSQMAAVVRVVPESDYLVWKENAADIYKDKSPVQIGELVRTMKGCATCHTVDGSPGTGPTWLGIWGETHQFTNGSSAVVDENYIRESILDPGAKIRNGFPNQMVSYQGQLSEEEMNGLIAYIQSLGHE